MAHVRGSCIVSCLRRRVELEIDCSMVDLYQIRDNQIFVKYPWA